MSKERELLKKWMKDCMWRGSNMSLLEETKEFLAQPEHIEDKLVMVEPAAWMYERQNEDFTERTLSVGFEKNFDGITIPLYTSPPKRKPLSNEDIANLEILSKTLDSLEYRYGFINGVLYAEKAHGIGVDDE